MIPSKHDGRYRISGVPTNLVSEIFDTFQNYLLIKQHPSLALSRIAGKPSRTCIFNNGFFDIFLDLRPKDRIAFLRGVGTIRLAVLGSVMRVLRFAWFLKSPDVIFPTFFLHICLCYISLRL